MRLSKIKLSGFKSFVDPTTISFPSNRVGVVGPNGCGKSNVIDAVRWVMGESSAKHLRGSAMIDVIFNGSNTRKPASQAAIELIFENVNFSQYPPDSEIAVKREIARNGQSSYFLNGTRCRRKDITDLFLGTGLGPRSYAIIEQGMISRLIEAKPEELRVFVEEAAGISKYKERRKETEQKMSQTQENLARLDEVRHELNNQLEKLKKQAQQAQKYQELQQTEHLLQAQLQALRWHNLDLAVQEQQQYIDEQTTLLEQDLQKLQQFSATRQQQREAQTVAQNTFNEAQTHFYQLENTINQLEQKIQHFQERHQQLQWDLEQLEDSATGTQQTLLTDQQRLAELEIQIRETTTDLATKQHTEETAVQTLRGAENQLQNWQTTWDDFNQRAATPTQQAQVERNQMQNIEQRLAQNQQRLLRLEEQEREIDIDDLTHALNQLDSESQALATELESAETSLTSYQAEVLQLRALIQQNTSQLHHHQAEVHKLNGRLASLEALQEAALGKNDAELNAWLQAHGLTQLPHLAQSLQVEPGWEPAVEMALGERLSALCVEDLTILQATLTSLPTGKLAFFAQKKLPQLESLATPLGKKAKLLLNKVQAPWPLMPLLAGIYTAETLADAFELRQQLAAHESIMTPTGIWLGPNWLSTHHDTDETTGTLAREQEITQIHAQLTELTNQVQQLTHELETQQKTLTEQEQQREQAQSLVTNIHQQLSQLNSQQSGKQARLEHLQTQQQRLTEERRELTEQISEDEQELAQVRQTLHAALAAMEQFAEEREKLSQQKESYQEQVMQHNQAWQTAQTERHQIEVRLESLRTDFTHLQQNVSRLNEQVEQLHEQKYELQKNLEQQDGQLPAWQEQLTEQQHQRTIAEEALRQAKQTVDHLAAALNNDEGERQRLETQTQQRRTALEQARMESQANQVRRQTLEEQLSTTDLSPVALVAELPEEMDEAGLQTQIETVTRKIERLGAVNMAALAECEEQGKRKKYLDEQANDLIKALELLENAIKTIDKETRNRFLQTLEQINNFLQTMFPKLFGGGEARLQLTGDDALKAGVTIMARPPGKRNTHIHLLSGGEKALTTIALVFAIFELNPAPFCMLDEVDAPLDDTNVGRFCTLVKTLSEQVQFIFISHNKITMEIAEQLIGVTMQEAGVSRPVTVDIEKAVDLVKV
jgi:chromosome segregation protein